MNLPILGTVSALFSNANEELKKLLQPWAILSALIFLGLGLFLIYQPLQDRFPIPAGWKELGNAEKVVIGTGVVLSVAYLIRGLGGFFLSLAGGRWLRRSPIIGRVLVYWQWQAYGRQRLTATNEENLEEQRNRAFYRLAYEYPTPVRPPPSSSPGLSSAQSTTESPSLKDRLRALRDRLRALGGRLRDTDDLVLGPTRLANARASVSAYSTYQYGAHLDTIWPALNQTLGEEDESLLKQMQDAQTTTTFLATLAVLLVVLAVIAAPVGLLVGDGRRLLAAVALLPVAYVFYHAAVAQALAWTRLIRAALDLHLDETATRLGLRSLAEDPATAKIRWQAVSLWLAYGGMKLDDPKVNIQQVEADWYKEKAKSPPETLTESPGVKATVRVTEQPPAVVHSLGGPGRLPGPVYRVTVMAGRTDDAGAGGGFVMISDTRVPMLPESVTGQIHWPDGDGTPTPVTAIISRDEAGPDALLWRLPGLAEHGGGVLDYAIAPEVWLKVGKGVELRAVLRDNSDNSLLIRLRYTGQKGGAAELFVAPVDKKRAGDSFTWREGGADSPTETGNVAYDAQTRRATWSFGPLAAGAVVTLNVTLTGHGLAE